MVGLGWKFWSETGSLSLYPHEHHQLFDLKQILVRKYQYQCAEMDLAQCDVCPNYCNMILTRRVPTPGSRVTCHVSLQQQPRLASARSHWWLTVTILSHRALWPQRRKHPPSEPPPPGLWWYNFNVRNMWSLNTVRPVQPETESGQCRQPGGKDSE